MTVVKLVQLFDPNRAVQSIHVSVSLASTARQFTYQSAILSICLPKSVLHESCSTFQSAYNDPVQGPTALLVCNSTSTSRRGAVVLYS